MAKQTAKFRRFNSGLLIKIIITLAVFVQGAMAFSQSRRISWDYFSQITIKSAQEYIFSASDAQFYFDIEGVSPENVEYSVDRLPDSVRFVSSKKIDLLSNPSEGQGRNGTRVIIWLRFSKAATYTSRDFPTVYVSIGYMSTRFKYEPFTVYTNPKTIQPQIGIDFENDAFNNVKNKKISLTTGESLKFTVNLQYAVEMKNFYWSLPENSIFQEVKRFPVTQNPVIGSSYSQDIVPIVTFEWKPLVAGTYSLPQIIVSAVAYNGNVVDLELPEYKITVKKGSQSLVAEGEVEEIDEFDYAFYAPASVSEVEKISTVDEKDIALILEARIKERHSVPFVTSAKADRVSLETSFGMKEGNDEPSEPLFIIVLALTVIVIAFAVVMVFLKKIRVAVVVFIVSVFMSFGTTVLGIQVYTPYALFVGGEVSPIPERNVMSGVTVQPGSRVKVDQRAGGWVYIGYNDTFGWVTEDSIYLIK